MPKLESIRIKNLRGLQDTGNVALKRITLLVGKNSSGKSTFARIFPLLRQSIEATKKGPILWWGRLVDFGNFRNALSRNAETAEISIEFNLNFDPSEMQAPTRRSLGRLAMLRILEGGTVKITVFFRGDDTSSFVSRLIVGVFDSTAEIEFDKSGFATSIQCGSYTWNPDNQLICHSPQDRLIPTLTFLRLTESAKSAPWAFTDPFIKSLTGILRGWVHGNTLPDKIRQLAYRIPIGPRKEIYKFLKTIKNPPSFNENISRITYESSAFQRLCDISFVSNLDLIIQNASINLNSILTNVLYLEPLRATAERYYRQQSLAIDAIDSKGENIAMFLDSLNYAQKHDFQSWTADNFGIQVRTSRSEGHISIRLSSVGSNVETNIADMGFGFSQVLPIAAQLWASARPHWRQSPGRIARGNSLVVIEQPELHLHPDYQARLGDLFCAAISSADKETNGVSIIAETHSPALVNRIGELIAEGRVDRSNVQVILFEQEDPSASTALRVAEFDDDGVLRNWPLGFFEPTSPTRQ